MSATCFAPIIYLATNFIDGLKTVCSYSSYSFLTSTRDAGEWPASRPGRALHPGTDPGTNRIGGWVDLRAGLKRGQRKILRLCRRSNQGHPFSILTVY
jgi:hypothetical protein